MGATVQEVTLNPSDMGRRAVLATTLAHQAGMSTAEVVAILRTMTGDDRRTEEMVMGRTMEDTTQVGVAGEEALHRPLMAMEDPMAIRIKAGDGEDEGIINLDTHIIDNGYLYRSENGLDYCIMTITHRNLLTVQILLSLLR